jgi:hypothetical protein
MNAVPRNSILFILSVVSRAFYAVPNGTLNKKEKQKGRQNAPRTILCRYS